MLKIKSIKLVHKIDPSILNNLVEEHRKELETLD